MLIGEPLKYKLYGLDNEFLFKLSDLVFESPLVKSFNTKIVWNQIYWGVTLRIINNTTNLIIYYGIG
jgi:hypothetical protein